MDCRGKERDDLWNLCTSIELIVHSEFLAFLIKPGKPPGFGWALRVRP
jgi:hypothetical protein